MSVQFTGSSTTSLLVPSAARPVATIYPLTVGGWYKWRAASGVTEAGFAVGGTAGGAIELLKNAADANTFVDEVGAAEVTLTGLFQANTWIHIIARFISSTNRRYSGLRFGNTFVTGSAAGAKTFTTSIVSLGCWVDAVNDPMTGNVAEFWWCDSDIFLGSANITKDLHQSIAFNGPFSYLPIARNLKYYHSFNAAHKHLNFPEMFYGVGGIYRGRNFLWTESSTRPSWGPHPPGLVNFKRDKHLPNTENFFFIAAAAAATARNTPRKPMVGVGF